MKAPAGRGSRAHAGWAAVAAATLLAGVSGCPVPAPREGDDGAASVGSSLTPTPGVAAALAASLEPDRGGPMDDGLVRRRVARLGEDVAAAAGTAFASLAVLDDGAIDARALPGGHAQVTRGLLEAFTGLEAEAAGEGVCALLAHLAAHEALGHPATALARTLRGAGVAALPSSLGPLVAGEPAGVQAAGPLGEALAALREPAASAPACAEADRHAARALVRLGIEPRTLTSAYARLAAAAEEAPDRAAPFEAAHGPLGARLAAAVDATTGLPGVAARAPRADVALDLAPLGDEARQAALLEAADGLVRRGHVEDALLLLERAGGGHSGARAPLVRARAALALGNLAEAERTLRAGLVRRPGDRAARVLLARLYVDQDRPGDAAAELREALRRVPLDAEAHLLLGLADPSAAAARLEIARRLDARDGPTARRAADALGLGRGGAPGPRTPPSRDRDRRILGGD